MSNDKAYGQRVQGFARGARVRLHPASDHWMAGDRYGTVVRGGNKCVIVYMDKSHRWLRFKPEILEVIDNDNARAIASR
jgi:hypothetical protein